jgi:2-desacetyl-2-hydroxyethyl bacteriochlorophyllide A dehydrogenase
MRALVTTLRDDGTREKILVDDWPDPGPHSGNQVRTRTLYSGITNGTERNDPIGGNYAHPDEALPAGWGYQNVGEVIQVGPDVRELKIGDLLYMSQDHLEFCLESEDGLHIELPEEVNLKEAALFGMAGVAMRSCRNADLRMGDKLLIVGAGFIGQTAAQIANHMGAQVTLCDIDERRLAVAREIGAAEEVFDVTGDRRWKQHIPDASFRAVLDLAGVPGMEDKLIWAAERRGTVVFIAGRFKVEYTFFHPGQIREITIKQNSHFDKTDLHNVCRLLRRGLLSIAPLIQDVLPVSEAKRVYDTLRDEPSKLFGTIFEWRQMK